MDFDAIYESQKAFQIRRGLFLGEEPQKETKDLALALHSEVSEILNCITWKAHRAIDGTLSHSNVKEEIIDIFKLWMVLANVWGLDPKELEELFYEKSDVVQQRWEQELVLDLGTDTCFCIDLDGVLCDYVKTWIFFLQNEGVETSYYIDDYTSLDFSVYLEDPTQYANLKRKYRETGWKRKAEIDPFAEYFMNKLAATGKKIAIVSARPEKEYRRIFSDTIQWLKKHNLPYDAVIFEHDKRNWVIENAPLVEFAVEDNPSNALSLARYGIKTYLVDKPYNREAEHENIIRVESLHSLVGVLKNANILN
tara:strand:+ start:7412 stop:8338 length:927 start_codon:yes stop_codon:yes gene_type:complete